MAEKALTPYTGLDLTDEKGMFCGKALGELGATVIKVEKPGGDPARRIGPFYHNIPDREKSLFWFFFNTNKKGITLNLDSGDGRHYFRELVKKVDFIIESFTPGYLDSLDLGFAALSKLNPKLVMISIAPFGQTGPYAKFKFDDIVGMAMGGYMQFLGDADRPPIRFTVPQSFIQAGAHAAMTGVTALYHAQVSGQGQQVDTSMVEAVARGLHQELVFWELDKFITEREGPRIVRTGLKVRQAWNCKDGQVGYRIILGAYARSLREVAAAMKKEGFPLGALGEIKDWDTLDYSQVGQEKMDAWEKVVGDYFMTHTKEELFAMSVETGWYLAPSYNVKEMAEWEHLKQRNFWAEIQHDELKDTIVYPAEPVKLDRTPYRTTFRAPLIGEHNLEIYEKLLGLSREDLIILKQEGVI
ncbi:MAG: CoA transferase [Chloroflexota bacterium]